MNAVKPYPTKEHGQTYSSAGAGANVTLGGNGVSHVAILWAGNPDTVSAFNDISSEYNKLTNLWGARGSIEVLFGNGRTNSVGAALPAAWNAQAATSANLKDDIAGLNLNPTTQFVFYATAHGGAELTQGDWPKAVPGGGQNVQAVALTGSDLMGMQYSSSTPTLTVDYTGLKASNVSVNVRRIHARNPQPERDRDRLQDPRRRPLFIEFRDYQQREFP